MPTTAPTTAAVLGAATPVGHAVLEHLVGLDGVDRVLAVDPHPLEAPAAVERRGTDPRDRLLSLALEDVDVVVHCALEADLGASPDALHGLNVGGTRNVLEACSKDGVDHLVVLVQALAYGAHDDNPLPLREDAPLRADPALPQAHQHRLVEEAVAEWADAHPSAAVTVLRLAPVVGGVGGDGPAVDALVRRVLAPVLVVPAGGGAPWQVVHVDDVADAVSLVVRRRLTGTYNVAADGWLSAAEVGRAVGRHVHEVGQSALEALLRGADRAGVRLAPPEVLPVLLHPLVLDTGRLRAEGWRPRHGNAEALRELAAVHRDEVVLGPAVLPRESVHRAARWVGWGVAAALWAGVRRARR